MAAVYDLKSVICTVGGVAIHDYAETDAITFEWDEPVAEPIVTISGQHLYVRSNNRGLTVVLHLSQTSRAYALLASLMDVQHGDYGRIHPPLLTPVPFFMIDQTSGDSVSGTAVFLDRPSPSKAKKVGVVEYRLHLSNPTVPPATRL